MQIKLNNLKKTYSGPNGKIAAVNGISLDIPENTIFARWGGEEFLIIFVGNTEIAEEALETIRSRVQDYSFRYFNKAIKLTITLGLSHPDKSFNFSKMLIEADKNLMKGKQTGKNRVVSGAAE